MDYDGTLCDAAHRFVGVERDISRALRNLLRKRIPVAIVTGRGRSAGDALRACLPATLWDRLLVGYYNGATVLPLSSDLPEPPPPSAEQETVAASISERLSVGHEVSIRSRQISFVARSEQDLEAIWNFVESHRSRALGQYMPVRSTHSIDLLTLGVSKLNAVRELERYFSLAKLSADSVVRIGDCGKWPGNDSDLLAHWNGLSVGTVSKDRETCWNLALPGKRGVAATLDYLAGLESTSNHQFVLMFVDSA
jgi:hydroxymethylpyrimidine pyrophosphatase-like HAD family hydrolase